MKRILTWLFPRYVIIPRNQWLDSIEYQRRMEKLTRRLMKELAECLARK